MTNHTYASYSCTIAGTSRIYSFGANTLCLSDGLLIGYIIGNRPLHVREIGPGTSAEQDDAIIRLMDQFVKGPEIVTLAEREFVSAFHAHLKDDGIVPSALPFLGEDPVQADTKPYGNFIPGGMYSSAAVVLAWNRMLITDEQACAFLCCDLDGLLGHWQTHSQRGVSFATDGTILGLKTWDEILRGDGA